MFLEEHVAFLKQEDLTLDALLNQLPIPNRPNAQVPPRFPPYFQTVDRERRARMIEKCADPNGELARRIQQIWLPLFTPPPPPSYVPKEVFMANMGKAINARFGDTAKAVQKLRARGGKIVFVRFPNNGELKALEDRLNPRARDWERLLKETKVPGIYFEDHPELAELHLSRVVASFRRRFRRIHQATHSASSRCIEAVKGITSAQQCLTSCLC